MFSSIKVNRTKQLTKQHIDLIDRIKQFKLQISRSCEFKQPVAIKKNTDYSERTKVAAQEEALTTILKSFESMSMLASKTSTTTQFLVLKPVPPCIRLNKIPSFYRQRTMPAIITNHSCSNLSEQKRPPQLFRNSSELLTKSSSLFDLKDKAVMNPLYYTNEKLSMCCPALLHNRLAFNNKTGTECRCRKQTIPLINDVEFDALLKLLPREQLAVIVIIDSK